MLQKLLALAFPLVRLSGLQPGFTPYCHNVIVALDITNLATFGIALGVEFGTAVLFLLIIYTNKKMQETTLINQALHSLPTRYQLR